MANFPSRTDIVTAMQNPSVTFKAKELIGGSIIQKGSRVVQYSGGYTTVFPFNNCNAEKVAIRCWIADIGEAKVRTQEISKYLDQLANPYFVGFKFIEDAILINGNCHAIVVMDWVEGKTLKNFIHDNTQDPGILLDLAEKFKKMVAYFHTQNIAHGDLQHGNLIIKDDGSLVVIDYDSMYINPLDGFPDVIKGLPGYQHPKRVENQYINSKLDYFSELVIYLSLLIFADDPHLSDVYFDTEDLLFSKEDFNDPGNSALIRQFINSPNAKIAELTQKFKESLLAQDILDLSPLEVLLVNKLEVTKANIFDKWDKQPNPPQKKETKLPALDSILDKF